MNDIVKADAPWLLAARSAEQAFMESCPDKERFNREFVFACQALRNNTFMQGCTIESIKSAIINIALTGATLNPIMQQAFLIPRNLTINKRKVLTCCLDFSYRGLIGLAVDGGSIIDMDSTCVYSNEPFTAKQGLVPVLDHELLKEGDRGEFVGVYAKALFNTGHQKFLYLQKEEVELVRKTSQAPNSPMWKDHYGEGARKSAIKKLYKMLPQSDRMSQAIHVLNEFEGLATLEDKGKEVTNRFVTPPSTSELPSGDTGEPPVTENETKTLLLMLDDIKTIESMQSFWAANKETIYASPDKDKLVEAIDYKRSELKEGTNET